MGCHPATNCICVLSWCLVISHKVLGVMSKESPDSQPQRHWPVSPDWTHQPPLLDSRESQRERERDVAVGFLLMQMKSWDSVLSIIPGAGHTVHHHLVPLLWAAPVLGHYLHQFSCCNQQMEQPQWKPFLSISEKRGSEVKGRQGEKGIEIRTWGGERKCGNSARKGDSVQHIKTEAQGQPGRGECMRRYPNQDGIIIFFPFCTVVLEQHCTKTEVNKS